MLDDINGSLAWRTRLGCVRHVELARANLFGLAAEHSAADSCWDWTMCYSLAVSKMVEKYDAENVNDDDDDDDDVDPWTPWTRSP